MKKNTTKPLTPAKWLETIGYVFHPDEGFEFEEEVIDHKWKDVFELLEGYAKHVVEARIKAGDLKVM